MKKSNLAIALALGLVIPPGVMAAPGNAVKQQSRERHELSFDAVNKVIELPDTASDKAVEQSKQTYRHRVRSKTGEADGKGVKIGKGTKKQVKEQIGEGVGALDRDRIRDKDQLQIHDQDQDRDRVQDQDRTMDLYQDQIRDSDHEFQNEPAMQQSIVEEPPMQQEQNEIEEPGKQQGSS